MASPGDRGIDHVDEFDMCEDEDGWLIVQHCKENIIRIQSIDMVGAIDYGSPAFKSYHTARVDGESYKAGIPTFDDLAYTLEGVEGCAWHLGYCSKPGRYEVFQNVEGPFESTNFAKVDAENISGLDFHVLDVHYEDHEEDPHEETLHEEDLHDEDFYDEDFLEDEFYDEDARDEAFGHGAARAEITATEIESVAAADIGADIDAAEEEDIKTCHDLGEKFDRIGKKEDWVLIHTFWKRAKFPNPSIWWESTAARSLRRKKLRIKNRGRARKGEMATHFPTTDFLDDIGDAA
ncbi:hypothetical protein CTRI78_v005605 [Colletotrichum trifolii]|uniref:Uncharacterized protein n=1 Tax=Colletotrichum trifolii TaxID=5466 RepID=A0A4R8REE7_COLTR|nr:hypothetical protein CTRI78_v005605 [Colletotrichum trifolii]